MPDPRIAAVSALLLLGSPAAASAQDADPTAALVLRSLEADSADARAEVRIGCERKPVWTASAEDDRELALWLAATVPGPAVRDLELAHGLLESVRVGAGDETGAGTRIQITTRRPVGSSTTWADGTLAVVLRPLAGERSRIEPERPERAPAGGARRIVVASPCVNLRLEPTTAARIVECVPTGTAATGLGETGEWTRLELADGRAGWVATRYLDAPAARPTEPAPPAPGPAADTPRAAPTEPEVRPAPAAPVVRPAPASSGPQAAAAAPQPPAETDAPRPRLAPAPDAAPEPDRIAELEARLDSVTAERDELGRRVAALEAAARAAEAAAEQIERLRARVTELAAERDGLRRRLGALEAAAARPEPEAPEGPQRAPEGVAGPALPTAPTANGEKFAVRPPLERAAAEQAAVVRPPLEQAAAEPAPAEPAAAGQVAAEEAAAAVAAWAAAWSGQRVEDYLAFYAPDFRPPDGLDRTAWEAQRRRRLTRPRSIEVEVRDLEVRLDGPERAEARFDQAYRSDVFADQVTKVLELGRRDGTWKILSERVEP